MNVQQQQNGSDCGVFLIAFAKTLLAGMDPTQLAFIDPRSHLASYLLDNEIPEFPTMSTRRSPRVQEKTVYIKLMPVKKDKEYEVDILSLI